jgi:hypothetical protein
MFTVDIHHDLNFSAKVYKSSFVDDLNKHAVRCKNDWYIKIQKNCSRFTI